MCDSPGSSALSDVKYSHLCETSWDALEQRESWHIFTDKNHRF